MKVKYTGRKYAVLAGVAILHGEIRDISKEQLDEAEKYHPGEFEIITPDETPIPPKESSAVESIPAASPIPEEILHDDALVHTDKPSAGRRSTPRRRSK